MEAGLEARTIMPLKRNRRKVWRKKYPRGFASPPGIYNNKGSVEQEAGLTSSFLSKQEKSRILLLPCSCFAKKGNYPETQGGTANCQLHDYFI